MKRQNEMEKIRKRSTLPFPETSISYIYLVCKVLGGNRIYFLLQVKNCENTVQQHNFQFCQSKGHTNNLQSVD